MEVVSRINEKSKYVISDRFDYFKVPPTLAQIKDVFYTWHEPTTSISDCGKSESTISFEIPQDMHYVDLSKCFVYMQVQLIQGLAAAGPSDPVSVVNLLGYSLIRHTEVTLNGTSITPSHHTDPYKHFINTTLKYTGNAKDTKLHSWGFARDTAGQMNELLKLENNELKSKNTGLLKRRSLFNPANCTVELFFPLGIDLANCPNFLPNGININVKLILNNKKFVLMCNDTSNYDYVIKKCQLQMCKVRADDATMSTIETVLAHGETAKFPYRQSIVRFITLNERVSSYSIDSVFSSKLPIRCVAGLVKTNALNGQFSLNPFDFQPFGLTYLSFVLNSKPYPTHQITPNFNANEFLKYYVELMNVAGIYMQNPDAIGISPEDYIKGLTLYGVDFCPSTINDAEVFTPVEFGPFRIEIRFDGNLTQSLTLVLLLEFQTLLEISRDRKVVFDHIL
jgi:hypothetical protein